VTTTSAPGSTLLEAVAEVARLAGDVALSHFRTGIDVEWKSDGSPVTVADRAAERAARDWIERRFPGDGILGEEQGETRGSAARRWILDPIDGTKSFVRGVPLWGTLVGVAEGTRILAGAAFFPAVGELVAAAPGQGCWWNGAACRVSEVASISSATVLTTDERFAKHEARRQGWRDLAARAAVSRTWGDCYGYLLVATGRAEVMVDETMNAWDAAAILPIVAEAGGVFSDWTGASTAFGGNAIATNAALARSVRETLHAEMPDA
jgi:histidinol phosphatase-like enzyme (inositol monophosphatase family)